MGSKVFFTDFRTQFHGSGRTAKLRRLMETAGFGELPLADKFVAIKMHFGEEGNLSYLRPQYARTVAEFIRELGGRPFLTDCNTLYAGSRKNAPEHLATAARNGFSLLTVGCPVIIADGVKGNDEVELPVPGGVHCRTAKIGRAIVDADFIVNLTHFKGHEKMGIGGAVKNLGMGCGSRAGKMEMHSDGKPVVNPKRCVGCGICQRHCAHGALTLDGRLMTVDHNACAGCGSCISVCPKSALAPSWEMSNRLLDEKTAEYAAAVAAAVPCFHISLLCDIAPNCDCHTENDVAIVPDIGMLAGSDPVAIDVASCDLCNQAMRLRGTWLDDCPTGADLFDDAHTDTRWRDGIEHAERLGLGSMEYELVTVK